MNPSSSNSSNTVGKTKRKRRDDEPSVPAPVPAEVAAVGEHQTDADGDAVMSEVPGSSNAGSNGASPGDDVPVSSATKRPRVTNGAGSLDVPSSADSSSNGSASGSSGSSGAGTAAAAAAAASSATNAVSSTGTTTTKAPAAAPVRKGIKRSSGKMEADEDDPVPALGATGGGGRRSRSTRLTLGSAKKKTRTRKKKARSTGPTGRRRKKAAPAKDSGNVRVKFLSPADRAASNRAKLRTGLNRGKEGIDQLRGPRTSAGSSRSRGSAAKPKSKAIRSWESNARVVQQMLQPRSEGRSVKNVIIGEVGTGKSFVLNTIANERCDLEGLFGAGVLKCVPGTDVRVLVPVGGGGSKTAVPWELVLDEPNAAARPTTKIIPLETDAAMARKAILRSQDVSAASARGTAAGAAAAAASSADSTGAAPSSGSFSAGAKPTLGEAQALLKQFLDSHPSDSALWHEPPVQIWGQLEVALGAASSLLACIVEKVTVTVPQRPGMAEAPATNGDICVKKLHFIDFPGLGPSAGTLLSLHRLILKQAFEKENANNAVDAVWVNLGGKRSASVEGMLPELFLSGAFSPALSLDPSRQRLGVFPDLVVLRNFPPSEFNDSEAWDLWESEQRVPAGARLGGPVHHVLATGPALGPADRRNLYNAILRTMQIDYFPTNKSPWDEDSGSSSGSVRMDDAENEAHAQTAAIQRAIGDPLAFVAAEGLMADFETRVSSFFDEARYVVFPGASRLHEGSKALGKEGTTTANHMLVVDEEFSFVGSVMTIASETLQRRTLHDQDIAARLLHSSLSSIVWQLEDRMKHLKRQASTGQSSGAAPSSDAAAEASAANRAKAVSQVKKLLLNNGTVDRHGIDDGIQDGSGAAEDIVEDMLSEAHITELFGHVNGLMSYEDGEDAGALNQSMTIKLLERLIKAEAERVHQGFGRGLKILVDSIRGHVDEQTYESVKSQIPAAVHSFWDDFGAEEPQPSLDSAKAMTKAMAETCKQLTQYLRQPDNWSRVTNSAEGLSTSNPIVLLPRLFMYEASDLPGYDDSLGRPRDLLEESVVDLLAHLEHKYTEFYDSLSAHESAVPRQPSGKRGGKESSFSELALARAGVVSIRDAVKKAGEDVLSIYKDPTLKKRARSKAPNDDTLPKWDGQPRVVRLRTNNYCDQLPLKHKKFADILQAGQAKAWNVSGSAAASLKANPEKMTRLHRSRFNGGLEFQPKQLPQGRHAGRRERDIVRNADVSASSSSSSSAASLRAYDAPAVLKLGLHRASERIFITGSDADLEHVKTRLTRLDQCEESLAPIFIPSRPSGHPEHHGVYARPVLHLHELMRCANEDVPDDEPSQSTRPGGALASSPGAGAFSSSRSPSANPKTLLSFTFVFVTEPSLPWYQKLWGAGNQQQLQYNYRDFVCWVVVPEGNRGVTLGIGRKRTLIKLTAEYFKLPVWHMVDDDLHLGEYLSRNTAEYVEHQTAYARALLLNEKIIEKSRWTDENVKEWSAFLQTSATVSDWTTWMVQNGIGGTSDGNNNAGGIDASDSEDDDDDSDDASMEDASASNEIQRLMARFDSLVKCEPRPLLTDPAATLRALQKEPEAQHPRAWKFFQNKLNKILKEVDQTLAMVFPVQHGAHSDKSLRWAKEHTAGTGGPATHRVAHKMYSCVTINAKALKNLYWVDDVNFWSTRFMQPATSLGIVRKAISDRRRELYGGKSKNATVARKLEMGDEDLAFTRDEGFLFEDWWFAIRLALHARGAYENLVFRYTQADSSPGQLYEKTKWFYACGEEANPDDLDGKALGARVSLLTGDGSLLDGEEVCAHTLPGQSSDPASMNEPVRECPECADVAGKM